MLRIELMQNQHSHVSQTFADGLNSIFQKRMDVGRQILINHPHRLRQAFGGKLLTKTVDSLNQITLCDQQVNRKFNPQDPH